MGGARGAVIITNLLTNLEGAAGERGAGAAWSICAAEFAQLPSDSERISEEVDLVGVRPGKQPDKSSQKSWF